MFKRALVPLLILALLLSLAPAAYASTTTMYVYTSNGKSLNLRDYPSKDGNILTRIPYGAKVSVNLDFTGSSWLNVIYGGYSGYCMARYIVSSMPGPTPTTTPSPTQSSGLYDNFVPYYEAVSVRPSSPGGYVHLRWAPSKQQPVQRDYYNGDTLTVLAQNGTWCQVYDPANNVSGFMMSAFLVTAEYAN